MKMNDPKTLIPWYLSHSLSASEQQAVETWLQHNPESSWLQQTQQIASVVTTQNSITPVPRIESDLLAKIHRTERKPVRILQWAWSVPLTGLLFILLWFFVQPGTQLQWSVTGSNLAAFRVYRAATDNSGFELLEEIPAIPEQYHYQYADETTLIPGKTYQYSIEIVSQNGSTATSPVVVSNSLIALSSQFAILLTSFILTFGMITIMRELNLTYKSNFIF